jgi:hypothetical protein
MYRAISSPPKIISVNTRLSISMTVTYRIICIYLITSCTTAVSAQSGFISGKVIDAETQTPLPLTTLRVSQLPYGTITNDEGKFQLQLPSLKAQDTLIVSRLGFESYRVLVSDIQDKQITVSLKVLPIQLKEITVVGRSLSAREIINKAYAEIKNKYDVGSVHYSAFYRETQQENGTHTLLADAALEIRDKDTNASLGKNAPLNEGIYLIALRRSNNYRNTIIKNTPFERWNLVISTLRCNPLKYKNYSKQLKAKARDFSIDSIAYINDREVYVVSFHTYLTHAPNFERKNTLYIDAEDFAIYRYKWEEYPLTGKYSERPWRLTPESIYTVNRKKISTTYEYEKYGDRMFLKYFDERCYDDIYNTQADSVELGLLGHTTLVVTSFEPNELQNTLGKPMDGTKSLWKQEVPFDKMFWNKYKGQLPLTEKQTKDLARQIPLDEQFQTINTN